MAQSSHPPAETKTGEGRDSSLNRQIQGDRQANDHRKEIPAGKHNANTVHHGSDEIGRPRHLKPAQATRLEKRQTHRAHSKARGKPGPARHH